MEAGRQLVFVYGTLRRGGSNHFRMEGAVFQGAASVRGRLYRIDWYPGLVLDENGGGIAGDVFAVEPGHLRELDDFEGLSADGVEGTEYRRVQVPVTLESGTRVEAWIWEWRGPVERFPEVAGGDWLAVAE